MSVAFGCSRVVVLLGPWALKLPNVYYGWRATSVPDDIAGLEERIGDIKPDNLGVYRGRVVLVDYAGGNA